MDLSSLQSMKSDPIPENAYYDITKTYYALILLPPSIDWPYESFACVVHAPAYNSDGGVIRAYNLNKSSPNNLVGGQAFFNSNSRLLRAFKEFVPAIVENRHGKLIWEGNINGFSAKIGSFFESPWFN